MSTSPGDLTLAQAAREAPAPLTDLGAIKVVIFDLDGTLHEDRRVTDYYAAELEKVMRNGSGLSAEVEAIVNGTHPAARPGCFVEPSRGIVVQASQWTAESASDWEGNPMPLPEDLQGRVRHNGPLRYLGDRWQLIGALASHRGADHVVLREAFTRARRFVNDQATALIRSEHLDDVLQRLGHGRRLLLATNTPEELAQPLVQRLDMLTPFDVVRFDARKPAGCAELIAHAHQQWGTRPPEVLVVGDNLWNDLLPPAGQGCRTAHIDPLGTDPATRWSSARYDDFSAFAAALKEMPDGA